MSGRLVLAIAASALVVLASPFIGEIRGAVERTFPGQYVSIVLAAVVLPAIVAGAIAVFCIREQRLLRYALLLAAVVIAVLYATAMETTRTEQFHFTEYGLLALLFYRAWRWRADITTIVLPVCAAIMAGFADEWFQWFVPSRVGEARDVVLNGVGVACGLLVAVALEPPVRVGLPPDLRARRALATGLSAVAVTGALFLQTVHLGYDVSDAEAGTFRSRFHSSALRELARERGERWRRQPPPPVMPLLSREDHYLSEALFHVQWRNQAASSGDTWTAWRENLILEKFYRPVLESGSPGSRWPAEQRGAVATVLAADTRPYVSAAYPFPIYVWNRLWFWGGTAALLIVVWVLCR